MTQKNRNHNNYKIKRNIEQTQHYQLNAYQTPQNGGQSKLQRNIEHTQHYQLNAYQNTTERGSIKITAKYRANTTLSTQRLSKHHRTGVNPQMQKLGKLIYMNTHRLPAGAADIINRSSENSKTYIKE